MQKFLPKIICYGSLVWHPYFQMSYYYKSTYTQENVVIKSNTFNSKNSEIQQMSKMWKLTYAKWR